MLKLRALRQLCLPGSFQQATNLTWRSRRIDRKTWETLSKSIKYSLFMYWWKEMHLAQKWIWISKGFLIIGTSATLCVDSPSVFSVKNYEFGNKVWKRYNFETAKGRNLKFRSELGHIWIILSANFGGNRSRDTGFLAKKWNANCRFKQL